MCWKVFEKWTLRNAENILANHISVVHVLNRLCVVMSKYGVFSWIVISREMHSMGKWGFHRKVDRCIRIDNFLTLITWSTKNFHNIIIKWMTMVFGVLGNILRVCLPKRSNLKSNSVVYVYVIEQALLWNFMLTIFDVPS